MLSERYIPVTESGCWLWLGHLTRTGYGLGRFGSNLKIVQAHRHFYTVFKGEIPDGLTIDHLCRVRSCVNPDHLEAVSMRTNVLRGSSVSANNSRKTVCKNGHEFSNDNTWLFTDKKGRISRKCKECSKANFRKWYRRKNETMLPKPL